MDDFLIDTLKGVSAGNVSGALFVLLLFGFCWREIRFWPKQIEKHEAEIQRSRDAHDLTRKSLLEEVGKSGETLVLVRQQMKSQEAAIEHIGKAANEIAVLLPEIRSVLARRRR